MKVKILFLIFLSAIYVYVTKDLSLYEKELKSHEYKGNMSNKAKGIYIIKSDKGMMKICVK